MYKLLKLFIIPLLLISTSCTRRIQDETQFSHHDDGSAKPKIALLPVIDSSNSQMPWDLSNELTQSIKTKFFKSNRFYLTDEFDALASAYFSDPELNPFLGDLEWINEMHSTTEFVVFIELVDHKLIPKSAVRKFFNFQLTQSYTLDMSVRVKVFDIRDRKIRIILQEMTHKSFHIPWKFSSMGTQKSTWNKTAFNLSPIGLAHNQMIKKITTQIQDYILLAKMNK